MSPLALLLALLPGPALPAAQPVDLVPINAGSVDASPLRIDALMVPLDLRQDGAFERVYRVDSSSPLVVGQPRFARRAGAMTAYFERSEYWSIEKDGETLATLAAIPAGTVFRIEGGFQPTPGPDPDALSRVRPDYSAVGKEPPRDTAPTVSHGPSLPPLTIWNSESARAARVLRWLDAASDR